VASTSNVIYASYLGLVWESVDWRGMEAIGVEEISL
jgi:hypothetical protein